MKIAIYGNGENIENQYAKCAIQAAKKGYEVVGNYDNIPELVERLSERDVLYVMMNGIEKVADNEFELEIISGTFGRYGTGILSIED